MPKLCPKTREISSNVCRDERGYMSEIDIQRQRGDIRAELETVQTQLNHNLTAARRIGSDLKFISDRLLSEPHRLVWPNEETDMRFQNNDEAKRSVLDVAEITSVRDAIRKLMLREQELKKQ